MSQVETMNPLEHFSFGGGATGTVLHPIVAVAMTLVVISIFLLPRKYVAVPLLFSICLTPYGQELYIGGVHVFVFRILILFGWVRLFSSKSTLPGALLVGGMTILDRTFFVWAIFRALAPVLLLKETGAVVNEVGFLWDAVGGYFLFRALIRDDEDIKRIIKMFAVVAPVVGLEMVREHFTGVDIFAFLGGILPRLERRGGVPRAMGPFGHALLAGTFGATLLPLFFWLWKSGKSKLFAIVGGIGCTLMSTLTMCSSPVLAYVAGLGAIFLWPFRNSMRTLRWGIVASCVALQLFMKVPFYFVLGHIDLVGGSNGWYRAALIDTFLRHFSNWWLIGTNSNMNWYGGAMWDQCNQFVTEGETGGLVTLVLFIAMICICFRWLGMARKSTEGQGNKEWYFWLLGVTLLTHVVGFFGIDYFDQTRFVWYALLAIVAAATSPVLSKQTAKEDEMAASASGESAEIEASPMSLWQEQPRWRPQKLQRWHVVRKHTTEFTRNSTGS